MIEYETAYTASLLEVSRETMRAKASTGGQMCSLYVVVVVCNACITSK